MLRRMETVEKQKYRPAAENINNARLPNFSTVHNGMKLAPR